MGMSASQARLLSITSRLTNNEFLAQTITDSKLRLASETTKAGQDYMTALRSSELVFKNYDDTGLSSNVTLTPAVLYDYAPMKNQYMLTNSAGRVLVNNTEAVNYANTESLADFLKCYDLLEDVSVNREETYRNPNYDKLLKEWQDSEPQQVDFQKEIKTPIKKWVHTDSKVYDAIADIGICFGGTIAGSRCYFHVLAALLGFGTFTTSDGNTFEIISTEEVDKNGIREGFATIRYKGYEFWGCWGWNTCMTSEAAIMDSLRNELKNDPVYDQPYEGMLNTEKHGIVPVGGDGTDAAKYNVPGGGNCWQKCIDLMWEFHEEYEYVNSSGGMAPEEELKKIWYFFELDLGEGHMEDDFEITYEDDVDAWQEAHDKWVDSKPTNEYLTRGVNEEYITVTDRDKAQWYTNLWYKMNGSETCNLVTEEEKPDYEELDGKQLFSVTGAEKNSHGGNYALYDGNIFTSSQWLRFALEQGIVSMVQAQYTNPSEDSGKAMELTSEGYTWSSILYTSARDIISQDNETEVTKAEVVYKRRLRDIKDQDSKFDQQLKKLDTEHNALQTEYESIKEVVSRNVERSFKAFS